MNRRCRPNCEVNRSRRFTGVAVGAPHELAAVANFSSALAATKSRHDGALAAFATLAAASGGFGDDLLNDRFFDGMNRDRVGSDGAASGRWCIAERASAKGSRTAPSSFCSIGRPNQIRCAQCHRALRPRRVMSQTDRGLPRQHGSAP